MFREIILGIDVGNAGYEDLSFRAGEAIQAGVLGGGRRKYVESHLWQEWDVEVEDMRDGGW